MHFALEDAYGYFEDAVAEAPRLSDMAEQLHSEHDGLFLEITCGSEHKGSGADTLR